MKRIGNHFSLQLIAFLFCLLCFGTVTAHAQTTVSIKGSVSETKIYDGERVQLSIEIRGDYSSISRPDLPSFKGLRLLSNTPSTSQSYSYVNGKSTSSLTYSYYLVAQQKGSFSIPPVSIKVDDETYKTDPIDIEILDRSESKSDESEQPDIFLKLDISDAHPVTGQQIIGDVMLYFKDGLEVASYQPVPGWKAEGFWKEELKNKSRPRAETIIKNGIRYRKARLLQLALFPSKAGDLEISPYEIYVTVRSSRRGSDPFSSFFGGGRQRKVKLSSDPVTISVDPVPKKNADNYLGAVGYFNISRSISTNKTKVGETIELKTQIVGTGNIPLINKPEYNLPDGLEVYEPQQNSNLDRKNHKISGRKTFTDVVIARSPGQYTIPAQKLSYYNPSKEKYITKELSAFDFTVEANPNAEASANSPQQFPIQPITGLASWVSPEKTSLIGAWWFWVGIAVPLVLLGVGYWQKSYREKMSTDQDFARSQKAADKASKRLDEAITLSEEGQIKQAYNMLQKALTGFVSDRLAMAEAGLSNARYVAALKEHDVEKDLIKNVRMLLDKCSSISYAPDSSHEYLKSHVGLAESTLQKLKKVL